MADSFPHRRQLLNLPAFLPDVLVWQIQARKIVGLALTLALEHETPPRGARRIPVDVEQLARQWRDLIARTITAHTKDEWDRADYEADALFGPILSAPIVQVREFTARLATLLEADERIPFRVWAGFRQINDLLIQTVDDQGIIELKSTLAHQVADLAEEMVPAGDWVQAMADALKWRDPEALEKMKVALESGKQPRVRGRESCLFLVVNEGQADECVVML